MSDNNPAAEARPDSKTKKVFNKKEWREKKYSNEYKVQRWQEQRKKQALRKLKPEDHVQDKEHLPKVKCRKPSKIQEVLSKQKENRVKKKEERQRIQEERLKAIKAYKEKKAARYLKLSQKNKKGQPCMKARMELLLEKIEKQYGN